MPPNLGGFFMVRSYYPSEWHADYFDFERIEALKPAIEACGISTLSQSPMLGFHKQMDNRIKLLEEILSFLFSSRRRHTRLQGDWSSDVCSSDLEGKSGHTHQHRVRARVGLSWNSFDQGSSGRSGMSGQPAHPFAGHPVADSGTRRLGKIGRASCRERV